MRISGWRVFAAGGAMVLGCAAQARAQSNPMTLDAGIFDNASYTQTSDAQPTAPSSYFLSIGASSVNGGDYNSAVATYPGPGSPLTLPSDPSTPGSFNLSTPPYATLANLHADYPFGTYSIAATGNSGSATVNLSYSADHFPAAVPFISNFSSLGGMNPAVAHAVNFPAYTPDAAATSSFTFLTIVDASTNTDVYDAGFLNPTSTAVTIPANTLSPNTLYNFELDYSNRIDGTDNVNMQSTELGFDNRTDGSFTTGDVPSPTAGMQVLLAAPMILLLRRPRFAFAR